VKIEMPKVAGQIKLPLAAVFEVKGAPAVWVVDRASMTVKQQPVRVAGAEGNDVVLAGGVSPGETVVIANLLNKVNAVKLHGSNTPVKFVQDDFRVRLVGLPRQAPELVTTFELECDSEPRQSHEGKRAEKPRNVTA